MSFDIRLHYKQKILSLIRGIKTKQRWKTLILDFKSQKLISSLFNLLELNEEAITLIENIEIQRESFITMEAIYFIYPSIENLELIKKDINVDGIAKYFQFHLLFLDTIKDDMFEKLIQLNKTNKIVTLNEFYCNFIPEEKYFLNLLMDKKIAFQNLYSPLTRHKELINSLDLIAENICQFLMNFNMFPTIRYHQEDKQKKSGLTNLLADMIYNKLNLYYNDNDIKESDIERPILLLLDRSFDLNPPFLYNFSYEPYLKDVFCFEDNKVPSFEDTKGELKEIYLDHHDLIYQQIKSKSITEAARYIRTQYNELLKNNQAAKQFITGEIKQDEKNLNELKNAVKQLPQVKQSSNLLKNHTLLTDKCINVFKERSLNLIAPLQKELTSNNKEDSIEQHNLLLTNLIDILLQDNIRLKDKVRVLSLYLLNHPTILDDRYRLEIVSEIKSHIYSNSISNISYIKNGPIIMESTENESTTKIKDWHMEPTEGKIDDLINFKLLKEEQSINCDTLHLKSILLNLYNNTLSFSEFPYLNPPSILQTKEKDEKTITFILGGVTLSEVKLINRFNKAFIKEKNTALLGSTHLILQDQFLLDLFELSKN
ncbi:Sec1-like protein [Neoconidiobolus thromboides FSU 785]|nr:Sec1-like protein [Neoconidiobolus thromboides FSU 785]